MMEFPKKIFRKLRKRNDRNLAYWEKAARKNPYAAICTSVSTEEEFSRKNSSILFESGEDYTGKVVLDLCCGLGRVARHVAADVKLYIGVDFSATMIRMAKERFQNLENVKFILNDGKTLKGIEDRTVDVCIAELAFQHINRDVAQSYVSEVYRVLKPEGAFLAQIPRLDYYKDKAFAVDKQETIRMFRVFSVEFVNYQHDYAYYLVRATKRR